MIKAAAYRTLVKNENVKIFFLIINEINKALNSVEKLAKLNKMTLVMSLKELKKKLLVIYHDFLNIFNKEKITQLSSHRSYDHKIKLKRKN